MNTLIQSAKNKVLRLRELFLSLAKRVYWKLPVKIRNPLVNFIYRAFPWVFYGTPHFNMWKNSKIMTPAIDQCGDLVLIEDLPAAKKSLGRIAIHLHMYYTDLSDEFVGYLKNMPFNYDLYISVTDEQSQAVCQKKFSNLPLLGQLKVDIVANRGRDIAPMFCAFGQQLAQYDYVAHLHSKKSLYNKGATEGWRQYLGSSLLGSPEQIRRIFTLLQGNHARGLVYPQNFYLIPYFANHWLANKALGAQWCARLGISHCPNVYFDFPAGTMFWARTAALKPLFDAGITLNDFAEEAGQTDGTFAHCLERLLGLVGPSQGYPIGIIKDRQTPSWSAWRFNTVLERSFETIHNELNAAKVKLIGFDIFDTLLSRPMLDPEAVKEIVALRAGNSVGNQNLGKIYLEYRAQAESSARQQAGRDINLHVIYQHFQKMTGLPQEQVSQLQALEEQVEYASVKPRKGGLELYHKALATGKPVVLISDMFLPIEHIKNTLQQHGIEGWQSLYLSSDIGLRKDTGELYKYLLDKYALQPQEFLMVGDNERSDLQIPLDLGANALHTLRATDIARSLPRWRRLLENIEQQGTLNDQLTLGLVLQKNFAAVSYPQLNPYNLIKPTAFNVGYSLVGPLLTGFAHWLSEQARDNNIGRLYFLAREGELIKQVFDRWTANLEVPASSHYLVVSRRAVSVPSLKNLDDILKIARSNYYANNLASFLKERFGLSLSTEQWQTISEKTNWQADKQVEVRDGNTEHLLELFKLLEADILAAAAVEKAALLKYLASQGMEAGGKQTVVDVGYGATIQGYLNELLTQSTQGHYLLTDDRSEAVAQRHNVDITGCYYGQVHPAVGAPLMYRYNFELEKLLSSDSAQVVKYTETEQQIAGVFRDLSLQETACQPLREELQQGVLAYVDDAINIREQLLPEFAPSTQVACRLYETFVSQLSDEEITFLKKITLDDYYCGRGLVS